MVGVHALVLKEGQILLVQRAKEPSKGKWSLPGGRVELGETFYEAASRELLEECAIEIGIERIVDVADFILRDEQGRTKYHFVLIYLLARQKGGEIKANSESVDVRWVPFSEVYKLDMHPQLRALLKKVVL
jgi:ADP-ribose pyrophosphatase YjhB (NUDIX family)